MTFRRRPSVHSHQASHMTWALGPFDEVIRWGPAGKAAWMFVFQSVQMYGFLGVSVLTIMIGLFHVRYNRHRDGSLGSVCSNPMIPGVAP